MQRSGLVHISSMTAVCEAPRRDRASALQAVAGPPPWQSHLLHVCNHGTTRPRLKTYERGGVRALLQCLECGQKVGNFISLAGVSERWDTALEERVRSEYQSSRDQWDRKRIEAFASADTKASTEWWTAYDRYLQSAVWAVKRERVFERCGGVCESCGEKRAEHVHHKPPYPKVFGLEPLWDLAAVCVPCHKIIHPHME
jgi:5-methylcytosine-specific restriction endonuclease McrA